MALVEAELVASGATDNINQEIRKQIPERSIEAIKGKRRPDSYKKRMEELVKGILLAAEVGRTATTDAIPPTDEGMNIPRPTLLSDIDEDPELIIQEDGEEVDQYNMDDSTILYECTEKYVEALNSDQRLRPEITVEERSCLDKALYDFENNSQNSKDLVNTYLSNIIKPNLRKSRKNYRPGDVEKLSNRKLKKKKYADFMRLYKKKRKSAFESIYSNNSISKELLHTGF